MCTHVCVCVHTCNDHYDLRGCYGFTFQSTILSGALALPSSVGGSPFRSAPGSFSRGLTLPASLLSDIRWSGSCCPFPAPSSGTAWVLGWGEGPAAGLGLCLGLFSGQRCATGVFGKRHTVHRVALVFPNIQLLTYTISGFLLDFILCLSSCA